MTAPQPPHTPAAPDAAHRPPLSAPDFAWPLLPHHAVLDLVAALDLPALDTGVMGNRSHLRPEHLREDPEARGRRLREDLDRRGLGPGDVFLIPWTGYRVLAVNHPDPGERRASLDLFDTVCRFTAALGSTGVTLLPGAVYGDEPRESAVDRSAAALRERVARAADHGLAVSVEGHLGSPFATPGLLTDLLDRVPGLTLTLDYTHFTHQGIPDAEVEPLLAHARHFHCRGAAPGVLQTGFDENVIDYARVLRRMADLGYGGLVCLEYVWTAEHDCRRVDNTAEIIRFREFLRGGPVPGGDPAPGGPPGTAGS